MPPRTNIYAIEPADITINTAAITKAMGEARETEAEARKVARISRCLIDFFRFGGMGYPFLDLFHLETAIF
jgi:hypothetical protein